MAKKLTNEQFLEKAKTIHGDKYLYLDLYIDAITDMKMFCKIHQKEFYRSPNQHLSRKRGCPDCRKEHAGDALRSNTNDFIKKAKLVHPNNEFGYLKVKYHKACEKVEIDHFYCNRSFWQTPNAHLAGRGCTHCNTRFLIELSEFIRRATEKHGNKFDYSLIENFKGMSIEVPIRCNTCRHVFHQNPSNHTGGYGCPNCAGYYVYGTDSFIEKARKTHGDKYDYSKSVYIESKVEVKNIYCKICNKYFDQLANVHIGRDGKGSGCPYCACRSSSVENEWLDFLNIPKKYRQSKFKISGKLIKTDAYDPITNTVYQFHGDYWHGNPQVYNPELVHGHKGIKMKEMYEKTIIRDELIKQAGYNLIVIWEKDWEASLPKFIIDFCKHQDYLENQLSP